VHPKITLITYLNAIMEHSAFRDMCPRPRFKKPSPPETSTLFLYPAQATGLVRSAALHLRPLLVFLIGVGCRPDEALSLEWPMVDLRGGQATLILGKVERKEHTAVLRPVVVRALQSLPHREGVFRTWLTAETDSRGPIGPGYTAGRFTTAWETACAKAGLPGEWVEWVAADGSTQKHFDPKHNPYGMRHTFATWYRCVYKDLADLRDEIGWTTTRMGERYGKKMSRIYEPDVLAWWNDEVDLGLGEVEEVSCKIRAIHNIGVKTPGRKNQTKTGT
jgi:integrase